MQSRLTVVESIYFQPQNGNPKQVSAGFERKLSSTEDPYERNLKITTTWQKIDWGWLEDVGTFVISNEEGKRLQKIPTPEEEAAIAACVVEISYSQDSKEAWLIPPGESMRGFPKIPQSLFIRCQSETVRIKLFAVPK